MKCPKCGFNSFELYDSCKKCAADLVGYKSTYAITSMVIPREAKAKLATELRSSANETVQNTDTTETHNDMFSFDLPDDSSPSPAQHSNDPFDFVEPAHQKQPSGSTFDDNMFSDLLESTSQSEESPFAAAQAEVAAAAVPGKGVDSPSEPGEFDLESFSWDDTPADSPVTDSKEVADDFDSLFGGTKENSPK